MPLLIGSRNNDYYKFSDTKILRTVDTVCVFRNGQSLAINWFVVSSLQPITCHLIRLSTCTLSHMTYLMGHVISLNNICE